MLAYWLAKVWPFETRAISNSANGPEKNLPCFCLVRHHYSNPSTVQIAGIHGGDPKVVTTLFPAILPGSFQDVLREKCYGRKDESI